MQNFRSRFPNLDALIAFEAAARFSSFALAAKELNVTASAVSQQIKALEGALDATLFTRGHRSVQLTEKGKEFSSSVSIALMHLSNAATDLSGGNDQQQIMIAADTSIVAYWLMPKLKQLAQIFPDCTFRLFSSDVEADLLNAGCNLAVLHGRGNWQGFESTLLFEEEVFPVCHPDYFSSAVASADPGRLAEMDLLDLEYENWHWMNWTIWLTEQGLPLPAKPRKMISNSYPSLIDAARSGEGFALAWRGLHEEELSSGSLIAPYTKSVKTRNGYHLAWPYNQPVKTTDLAIRNWLIAEHSFQSTT